MNDKQLMRYSRHIMLPQIGFEGQQKLMQSRVLIIGMGGLGSPASIYLAASGVGHLVLVDDDQVELSNLQRQVLHVTAAIGEPKVDSAARTLQALNPEIQITRIHNRLEGDALTEQVRLADVVVDASDNFATRFAINQACVQEKTPLISGAVIRMEGQITVFQLDRDDSPCYGCLYQDTDELAETCAQNGVLAPVVGIIGTIQATETIKVLLNLGVSLHGRLLLLDAATMEWRSIKLRKDPACPVCG